MRKFTREEIESWGIILPPENPIWGWDVVVPLGLGCILFGFWLYWLGMSMVLTIILMTILYYGIAIKHGQ